MLELTQEQFERIVRQGLDGKPFEICGLLAGENVPAPDGAGTVARVAEVYPVDSDDRSPVTYTLNATGYARALKDMKERGWELVGIYHTHPATRAYPSPTDVARAHWGEFDDLLFPGVSYLIVSLRDAARPEPHSFKINGRRIPDDILEEPVNVAGATLDGTASDGTASDGAPEAIRASETGMKKTHVASSTVEGTNGHRPIPIERQAIDAISILDYVGNTPLFRFRSITSHLRKVEVYGKAEYLNPGGSVKDRAALSMILLGEQSGALTPGKTILDSTSGNTGIAYAMIGAARGYNVKLVMPGNVSQERKNIVAAYGAEVVLSDALAGSDGAILLAREIYAENPNAYFKPDQYNNQANSLAHYQGTGPEIWSQTRGRISHFLATVGTSGTLMGTGRFLKERNPDIQVIAVEPDSPFHGIEGLKHMASSIKPGIYDEHAHDDLIPAATEDAYEMQARLAREEGIFVGFSAGAAIWAALHRAEQLEAEGQEAVVVTILCDRGDRYLSLIGRWS